MQARNAIVLLLSVSTLLFLAACGGNGTSPTTPVAPPSGGFSNSNLNGTYVFSISGTDATGAPYAMAGTFTANGSGGNGKGGITGGTIDINDVNTTEFTAGPIAGATISSSSNYSVGADGRGEAMITTNISGFGTITFDFVLSSNSHGLVTEFDSFGTASGTLDLQAANTTPTGTYAYSLSGATYSGAPFATVGNFTLGSGGAITTGLADFNNGALTISPAQALSGTVAVASTPSTTLTTAQYPSLIFDVFPVSGTQLKFIEMDENATLSGEAFSQTTTTIPAGTLAFTLQGQIGSGSTASLVAAGGFMVTDGNGNITNASTEDFNQDGTLSPATPVPFTATYASATGQTGRYTFTGFSGFTPSGALTYAAYPSSGGVLLLEIDTLGLTTGAAYTQSSSATLGVPQGYALNLSGVNLSAASEVDDIAEFATVSGGTITGIIDENSTADGPATFGAALTNGAYLAPTGGRGQLSATAGTSSNNTTLNTGFDLTFYVADGTTFPFIETDSGQVASGVFVLQSASGSTSAAAHPNMFVPHAIVRAQAARKKKN
jgi:hypothetical protein